ncbi:hypothetical protein AAV35_014025 (plasmid) [Salimicrobium jeotgali]|uniref:Uncharacterized protein n=1 Tax=Salimicrobium jeotgali TaxID=1230341 RepID=K2G928_9BACI|nr:hypothetical protein [Salimicrobium jeotgali]AKN01837.1 hypothetical protein AAV35_014025 [Salimicrobium jeotgali]EKE30892.1 hypothetical protein MJ3_11145 [Salimicrobium jeotgali]MBM7697582.1 hypothetical protein [Salimicrobium jeotgali]
MVISQRDFYCGLALTQMMEPGKSLELLERSHSTVLLVCNKNTKDEKTLYMKYRSTPETGTDSTWNFTFTPEEMKRVQHFQQKYPNLSFLFVCGKKDWPKSDIAIFSVKQAMTCLHPFYERPSYRISIRKKSGGRKMEMYGTGVCKSKAVRI